MANSTSWEDIAPRRPRLIEVNPYITCMLCRGYLVDATTIVECLHSFCRSCIINHLNVKCYCPVCELMINMAKPNIKPDKALQDIVYKLVPGLFEREMERRRMFYEKHPKAAALASPEQRGEDMERLIFSPDDKISLSLEMTFGSEFETLSTCSSDSGTDSLSSSSTTNYGKRYLECPAKVKISHLKKFLIHKYDIDTTRHNVNVMYKRVPLPEFYTLMDTAYIYTWKRNEPMRFFYNFVKNITSINDFGIFKCTDTNDSDIDNVKLNKEDFVDINNCETSPVTEETEQFVQNENKANSPVCSSFENNDDSVLNNDVEMRTTDVNLVSETKSEPSESNKPSTSDVKPDSELEKSQFLELIELTAKKNCSPQKNISSNKSLKIKDCNKDENVSAPTKKSTDNKTKVIENKLAGTPKNGISQNSKDIKAEANIKSLSPDVPVKKSDVKLSNITGDSPTKTQENKKSLIEILKSNISATMAKANKKNMTVNTILPSKVEGKDKKIDTTSVPAMTLLPKTDQTTTNNVNSDNKSLILELLKTDIKYDKITTSSKEVKNESLTDSLKENVVHDISRSIKSPEKSNSDINSSTSTMDSKECNKVAVLNNENSHPNQFISKCEKMEICEISQVSAKNSSDLKTCSVSSKDENKSITTSIPNCNVSTSSNVDKNFSNTDVKKSPNTNVEKSPNMDVKISTNTIVNKSANMDVKKSPEKQSGTKQTSNDGEVIVNSNTTHQQAIKEKQIDKGILSQLALKNIIPIQSTPTQPTTPVQSSMKDPGLKNGKRKIFTPRINTKKKKISPDLGDELKMDLSPLTPEFAIKQIKNNLNNLNKSCELMPKLKQMQSSIKPNGNKKPIKIAPVPSPSNYSTPTAMKEGVNDVAMHKPPETDQRACALRNLIDSGYFKLPSSLSISLTESKDPVQALTNNMNVSEMTLTEVKSEQIKLSENKRNSPVNNYIEILKLPEQNAKCDEKTTKTNQEISLKSPGPIPSLKPIDTKISKSSPPQTFQQTFLQSLQQIDAMRLMHAPKSNRSKTEQFPVNAGTSSKPPCPNLQKSPKSNISNKVKSDIALDLSSPSTVQGKLSEHEQNHSKLSQLPLTTAESLEAQMTLQLSALFKTPPANLVSNSPGSSPPCEYSRPSSTNSLAGHPYKQIPKLYSSPKTLNNINLAASHMAPFAQQAFLYQQLKINQLESTFGTAAMIQFVRSLQAQNKSQPSAKKPSQQHGNIYSPKSK